MNARIEVFSFHKRLRENDSLSGDRFPTGVDPMPREGARYLLKTNRGGLRCRNGTAFRFSMTHT